MPIFFSSDPAICEGRLCLAGLRVTVDTVLALMREHSDEEILTDYPYLRIAHLKAVRSLIDGSTILHSRQIARDLAAQWIELEREQMQTITERNGTPHRVSSLRSHATHACRRDLQVAFGLVLEPKPAQP